MTLDQARKERPDLEGDELKHYQRVQTGKETAARRTRGPDGSWPSKNRDPEPQHEPEPELPPALDEPASDEDPEQRVDDAVNDAPPPRPDDPDPEPDPKAERGRAERAPRKQRGPLKAPAGLGRIVAIVGAAAVALLAARNASHAAPHAALDAAPPDPYSNPDGTAKLWSMDDVYG